MDNFFKMTSMLMAITAIFLSILTYTKQPTVYETYNEALKDCGTLQNIEERNMCRIQVTQVYKNHMDGKLKRKKV